MAALRFRRFGRGKGKPRLLLGVHPMPTMVTLGNLLCGFASIVLAMRAHNPPTTFFGFGAVDCLYWSAILIFVAMIFDAMDGRVARWTKSASKFGLEMDSLCDVVSFGVAPAVLVKATIDHLGSFETVTFLIKDRYVWLMLATYVACAALRLARYNVESENVHRNFFFGIPSPAAAGCVASVVIWMTPLCKAYLEQLGPSQANFASHHIFYLSWFHPESLGPAVQWTLYALPFHMLCLGILMVSRVHYIHAGDRLLTGKRSFMHLLILGLALVLIILQHEMMLMLLFNGYMLVGVCNELRYQIFPSQRPKEWTEATQDSEPTDASAPAGQTESPPPAPTGEASQPSA